MMHIRPVGAELFLVWLVSTNDQGEPFEWCVSHEHSAEAAESCVAQSQRIHVPTFAHAYRIERVVSAEPGERKAFVGTAKAGAEPEPETEPVLVGESSVLF